MSKVSTKNQNITQRPFYQPLLSLLILSISLASLIIPYYAPNSNAFSDSYFNLLVSQAIIEHQTIQLDQYADAIKPISFDNNYRIWSWNDHYYNSYPLGPSLLATPYVFIMNKIGWNMADIAQQIAAQNIIAALTCFAIFNIIYALCRLRLSREASLIITTISFFGSSFISILGTAYWNMNPNLLVILITLWLILRHQQQPDNKFTPYLVGLCLFISFLCRPMSAIFIALTLLYLLWYNPLFFLKTSLVAGLGLGAYLIFNQIELGLWLTPYYAPNYLYESAIYPTPWPLPLYGLLFSPARGLFIFTPFLLLVLIGVLRYIKEIKTPLLYFALTWISLHIAIVSRFNHWWGGSSYGPRLLTDSLPAFVLLTIFLWPIIASKFTSKKRWLIVSAYIFLGLWGIILHTYVGLFGHQTPLANGDYIPPMIDEAPEHLFSWEYAPFLLTPELACQRNTLYYQEILDEQLLTIGHYRLGYVIDYLQSRNHYGTRHRYPWAGDPPPRDLRGPLWAFKPPRSLPPLNHTTYLPITMAKPNITTKEAAFIGWSTPDDPFEYVWSFCPEATIILGPIDKTTSPPTHYQLEITTGANGHQNLTINLNNHHLDTLTIPPSTETYQFTIPSDWLHTDKNNYLNFTIPHTKPIPQQPHRPRGLAFHSLSISTPPPNPYP
ncbi:MAG TPA: hypothetical protein VLL52_23505 [Anaerolineae bacterium]|nr:hypothetical protein [Anaerolineae bacterium]